MTDGDDMSEIIAEFLVESRESLDRLDGEFVLLEQDPGSAELLGSIFRTVHTIKGTAAFLDFGRLEQVTHAGENLLSLLRDGAMQLDSTLTTVLLEMVDMVRAILDLVETEGTDSQVDVGPMSARLIALASGEALPSAEPEPEPEPEPDPEPVVEPELDVAVEPELDEPDEAEVEPVPAQLAFVAEPTTVPAVEQQDRVGTVQPARTQSETSIRVDVALLDRLMNLVSELVLARNQISQNTGSDASAGLQAAAQQLDIVTGDLQQALMETRMQPIGNLWGRLPRMVRDLATTCNKRVSLEMEGSETELDKTLLEAIRDPLTHIIRNAVDHGLETPEARVAAGKPETGTVSLRARHEGGQVIMEITDDGKGLDLEAIVAKVIERRLMTADAVAALNEREMANLVFLPGLSTAKAVTKVSGRGVGMDVVKRSIDEIGGTIDIQTELGRGTVFTLRIPLTLAIIPALRVRCGDERYLIPQLNVSELHRVDPRSPIELVGDTPLYRLRGELLPLLHWSDVLDEHCGDATRTWTDKYIVVVDANGRTFGFVVDAVENTEEIVVKPLRAHLKDIDVFAGSTVLGDGSVALILDPLGITRLADLQVGDEPTRGLDLDTGLKVKAGQETMLVCTSGSSRVGFPLDGITRLESIPCASVEQASGIEVVTYRGRLMRLIRLQGMLGGGWSPGGDEANSDVLLVLVHESEDDVAGIVVDKIIEVASTDLAGSRPGTYPVRVSALIDGRVTDVIDIDALVGSTRGTVPAMNGAW